MKKVEATLLVHVIAEIDDDESTDETMRYLVEQDLEDAGFTVDVSVLRSERG